MANSPGRTAHTFPCGWLNCRTSHTLSCTTCVAKQVQLEKLTEQFQTVTEDMRRRFAVDGEPLVNIKLSLLTRGLSGITDNLSFNRIEAQCDTATISTPSRHPV